MLDRDRLKNVDPAGIQTLMRVADKDKMTMALKGASDELKDLFFSNMSGFSYFGNLGTQIFEFPVILEILSFEVSIVFRILEIRETGGWLHVHGNVGVDETACVSACVRRKTKGKGLVLLPRPCRFDCVMCHMPPCSFCQL